MVLKVKDADERLKVSLGKQLLHELSFYHRHINVELDDNKVSWCRNLPEQ